MANWVLLAVAAVAIFVMLIFGMALISTGQQQLSNDTVDSAEYQPIATSVDTIMAGMLGVPFALLIMALGVVLFALVVNRR
jgi:hypothetical protein